MDFIKELELYLENTPELLGQKLLIIQAMRSGELNEKQIHKAWAGWVTAGVAQYFEDAGYTEPFGFHEYDLLISKYMRDERGLIEAGAYKELDLIMRDQEFHVNDQIIHADSVGKDETIAPEQMVQWFKEHLRKLPKTSKEQVEIHKLGVGALLDMSPDLSFDKLKLAAIDEGFVVLDSDISNQEAADQVKFDGSTYIILNDAGSPEELSGGDKRIDAAPEEAQEMPRDDFNDPEKLAIALAKQFAKPEDENYPEILEEIKDSLDYNESYSWRGMADFEADGDEYTVIRTEEGAELIAIDQIKDSMDSEPESFATGDWLRPYYYISDTDKRIISGEYADAYIEDLDEKDLVQEYGTDDEKEKFDAGELNEQEMDSLRERADSEYSDQQYKKMEKDPVGYCEELGYDLTDNRPSFLQLDTGEAAKHAVDVDGWAHELSRYDGNYETTVEGLVYFKR